jgi:hypothetical protein
MSEEILKTIRDLLSSGKGDPKRLRMIVETIKKGEPIVMSDYRYIQTLTEEILKNAKDGGQINTKSNKKDSSLKLLRVRLAEGQITIEEYRKLKQALTEDE